MNHTADVFAGPIVVGGLGGSGTRAVAHLLSLAGVDMGSPLNGALDHLGFSFLLRRAEWFVNFPSRAEVDDALDLFDWIWRRENLRNAPFAKLPTNSPNSPHARYLAAFDRIVDNIEMQRGDLSDLFLSQATTLRARLTMPADDSAALWGWKEPNTHIFLPDLVRAYPEMKYILVVRDGRDMVLSKNQSQVRNWGSFLLEEVYPVEPTAAQVINFWVAAHERALKIGRRLLGDRFLILGFERLCQQPMVELPRLSAFLGRDIPMSAAKAFLNPTGIGRYGEADATQLSSAQIHAVQTLLNTLIDG